MKKTTLIDKTGLRIGRLTVLHRDMSYKGAARWVCKCDCGNTKTVRSNNLKHGVAHLTQSCGCLARTGMGNKRHGMSSTPTFRTWAGMLQRCRDPKQLAYKNYGGRGIRVCKRWEKFENFFHDMGERPDGLSIERVNNNLGYSPENCVWADRGSQNRNTRATRMIEFRGERLPMNAWCRKLGIKTGALIYRLRRWPIEKALTEARSEKHLHRLKKSTSC